MQFKFNLNLFKTEGHLRLSELEGVKNIELNHL